MPRVRSVLRDLLRWGPLHLRAPLTELPRVRVVYLVPSDRSPQHDFETATGKAIKHVQRWYRDHMGNGKTFRLHQPVVEVVQLPHAEGWYREHDVDPDRKQWFWRNVLDDAFAVTRAGFHDHMNRWVFYIDSENDHDQAVGGNAGVALLPRHDLMGLIGQSMFPSETNVCRWVGGLGHELGHAFELPHPAGFQRFAFDRSGGSLMAYGYQRYPETFLNPEDIEQLDRNDFFNRLDLDQTMGSCSQLLTSA